MWLYSVSLIFTAMLLRPLFIFCSIIIASNGLGQWPAAGQMLRQSVTDGLSDNYIGYMAEDQQGFVWLATTNGLNRFNGREVVPYFTTNSELPSNNIFQVKSIPGNRLLLGTGAGVAIMHTLTGRIQVFPIEEKGALAQPANEVERVFLTPDNYMIAGTKTGVYILDSTGKIITHLDAGYTEADVTVRRIYFVLNMDMFSNGDALMATTRGYFYYHHATKNFEAVLSGNSPAIQVFRQFIASRKTSYIFNISRNDQLFFIDFKSATADTLFVFDLKRQQQFAMPLGFQPNANIRWDGIIGFHNDTTISLTANRNGIYLATIDAGRMVWSRPPQRVLTTENIRYVLRTSDSRWLMGSESGLLVQSMWKEKIKILDLDPWIDAERPQHVAAILRHKGKTWIGFNSSFEGLLVLDDQGEPGRKLQVKGLLNPDDNNKVRFLMPWQGDSILAGTTVGLNVVNTHNYSVTPFAHGRNLPDFLPIRIGALFRDRQGILWISQAGNGIWKYDPATGEAHHFKPGSAPDHLPLPFVHVFTEDAAGNIWMAHQTDGLVRWNRKTGYFDKVIRQWPGIKPAKFDCSGIAAHVDGSLWCFINGYGLVQFYPEKNYLKPVATITDRGEDECQTLLLTPEGHLWLSLRHGLAKYDTLTRNLQIVGAKQGLPAQFNTSYSLYYDSATATISAGFPNRVVTIPTRSAQIMHTYRGPYITGIQTLDNRDWKDHTRPFDLEHTHNSLRIDLAYVQYDAGMLMPMEYRLIRDTETAEWINLFDQHTIYVSNLSPGDYQFEVRPAMPGTPREAIVSTARFSIKPPFTQTNGFRLFLAGAVLLLFYILYRVRLRQVLRLQRLKQSISGDLHDDIGSRLTQIRFLNVLARQKLDNREETTRFLNKMEDEIKSSGEALDEIVWNMKAGDVDTAVVAARMRRYADSFFEDDNLAFTMETGNNLENLMLPAEQRKDLFLIFRELLNNIRKHAAAGKAHASLTYQDQALHLKVTDNGHGFDVKNPNHRHGLSVLKERLDKWGGKVNIHSGPERGTTVDIRIPIRRTSPLKVIFPD